MAFNYNSNQGGTLTGEPGNSSSINRDNSVHHRGEAGAQEKRQARLARCLKEGIRGNAQLSQRMKTGESLYH